MQPDAPLPVQPDLAMPTIEERLDALRAFYGNGVSDLMDKVLSTVLLPNDGAKVALDFAQLTAFLMCIKVVELRGQKPTRENLLAVWWPFQKALKDDVPPMIREFAATAVSQGRA